MEELIDSGSTSPVRQREEAKKWMLAGKRIDSDQNSDQGRTLEITAEKLNVIHNNRMGRLERIS